MLRIREMEAGDARQMSELERETFSSPWSEQDFRKAAEDKNTVYVVAQEDGVLLGMCGVKNILGEGEITNVAVKSGRRGEGIGSLLMSELLRLGAARGIKAFTLEVRQSNTAAIALYQKFSFCTEGIRRDFYEKPRENALIMWKR